MSRLRFFTDEDVYRVIAAQLRSAGFDAVSTPEAGRLAAGDEAQLEWAERQGRAVLTFNVAHFAQLHHTWMEQGRPHAGILVSQQRSVGDLLRRVLSLGRSLSAEEMRNRLEYLSNWPA